MEQELTLSLAHVDFGAVDYALSMPSEEIHVLLNNTSNTSTYEIGSEVFMNQSNDFPVKLLVQHANIAQYKDEKFILTPGTSVTLPLYLVASTEAFRNMGQRSSYFNVSSRCYLQYHAIDNNLTEIIEQKNLEFTFSASLCTSLMHIENADLQFNECVKRETYMQEITIWNRSESQLRFQLTWDGESGSDKRNKRAVKFYEADELREIEFGEILVVPSYAPKILVVRVMAEDLSEFHNIYKCINIKNLDNISTVHVHAKVVEARKQYLDNLIINDPETGTDWYCSNSTLPMSLGQWCCGKVRDRKFWFINSGNEDLNLKITIKGDVGNEVRMYGENLTKEKDISTTMPKSQPKFSSDHNVAKKGGSKIPKSESNVSLVSLGDFEPQSLYEEPVLTSKANVSRLCGQMFGNEYVESELSGARAFELVTEFGMEYVEPISDFRPFLNLKDNRKRSRRAKSISSAEETASYMDSNALQPIKALESRPSNGDLPNEARTATPFVYSRILLVNLGPNEKKLITLEVQPSASYQESFFEMKYKLLERNVELNITYEDIEDLSAKVNLSYKSCISKVSITPNVFNLGLCNIGESYPFTVVVTNESDLSTVLRPYVTPVVSDIEIKPFAINPHESRELNLQYLPARENHDYRVLINFENRENEKNTNTLEVTGRAVDTQHTQIHDFFYKISDGDSHNQNQVLFGKILACMPNLRLFRIKNISQLPLRIQFFTQENSSLKIYLVRSKKSNQVLEKKSNTMTITEESSLQRRLEFEDLKWGDKKNNVPVHGGNSRVSVDDDPESKYRNRGAKLEDYSQNLKALDVLPPQLSRSNSMQQPTTISRSIRQHSITSAESNMEESAVVTPLSQDNASANISTKQLQDQDNQQLVDLEILQDLFKQSQGSIMPWIFEDADLDSLEQEILQTDKLEGAESTKSANDKNSLTDFSRTIAIVQNFYQSLQGSITGLIQSTHLSVDLATSSEKLRHSSDIVDYCKSCETVIAEEGSIHAVIIWKPEIDGYAHDISTAVSLREYIQIRLPDIDYHAICNIVHRDAQDPDKVKVGELLEEDPLFNLAPKPLLVRSDCFRSEMTIVQRNINYGRVVVGDTTFKTVTIVNKSPVTCIYSFAKSGNISSGFLSILHGRKGVLAPFSTKIVQIIFKPTMPCTFEETLQIKNILNPSDEHTITIKAKVSKAESFALSVVEDNLPTVSENAKKFIEQQETIDTCESALKFILKSLATEKSNLEKTASPLIAMLGISAVGKSPTVTLKVKLRNPTNKKRQFIVDAVSKEAITLLDCALMKGSHDFSSDDSSVAFLQQLVDMNGAKFIPIPEYLQSILLVRCSITTEIVKSLSINQGMEEDEIRMLMDNLEKFQQKLKIAIRKEKPDKIAKYQKKIDDTIKKLSGTTSSTGSIASEKESNSTKNNQDIPAENIPVTENSLNSGDASNKIDEAKFIEDFDSAQYVWLNPEEERLLTIQLTYLPGPHYKSWKGILPFIGKVRIFEGKNEDNVKVAFIGSYLFSSLISMESPTGEDTSSLVQQPNQSTKGAVGLSSSASQLNDNMGIAFDLYIPDWSSISTKNIFPKYKKLPANILGASLKLSRTSKDRTLSGKFFLTNLLRYNSNFTISLNTHYTSSTTSSYKGPYKPFDPMSSGELHLITNDSATSSSISDSDDRYLRSWGNADPRQFERKSITHDIGKNKYELMCNAGKRKEFSLVWVPFMNVQQSTIEEFNMFGTLEITFEQQSMIVPFVSVYRHNSIVKAEKYHTIEDVSVGSFVVYKMLVENESTKLHLHYGIILEQVSEKYFSRGSLEVISGRTGVIPPQGKAYVQIRFYGTAPGRFEQKMWVRNLNDNFDQRRIIFQASVILSQAQFVVFPELELSSSTGKYSVLNLGHLQIKSKSTETLLCFDDSIQQSLIKPYELKMKNVSNQRLTVTAIPNLRNQCFIYSNEICTESAINVALEEGQITTLYVVLKPADVGKSKIQSSFADSVDNSVASTNIPSVEVENQKQMIRELVGGIRLVFFVHDEVPSSSTSTPVTDSAITLAPIESPRLQKGFSFGRKLFETALSFQALVGKSILHAELIGDSDGILKIKSTDNPDHFSVYNKGVLRLKNYSDVFPLNYAFYDDDVVRFNEGFDESSILEVSEGSIELMFKTSKRGKLVPTEEKDLEFWIAVGTELTGIHTKSIRILNLDTNDIVEICLALFIDPNKVKTLHDKIEEELLEQDFGDRIDETFQRTPECYVMKDTFWLRINPTEENHVSYLTLQPSHLEVVRIEEKIFGSIYFKNTSNTSITLQPMSDLPIVVAVEILNAIDEESEQLKLINGTSQVPVIPKKTENFDSKSASSNKASSQSVPTSEIAVISKVRRKFKKCGETIVVKPNCVVVGTIKSKSGVIENELGKWMDMRKLSKGNAITLFGHLCFIEKLSSLQSIFSRPNQEVGMQMKSPVNFSGTEITITSDSDYFLPVVHVTTLECKFMLPRLKIKPQEIDLGQLRLNNTSSFHLEIKNNAQVDIICVLDNLPNWITVISRLEESIMIDSTEVTPRRAAFIARIGSSYNIECLVVAPDTTKSNIQQDFKVKSIPCSESIEVSDIVKLENLDASCTSIQTVGVKMKIDKRAALEIAATSNETLTLVPSAHANLNTTQEKLPQVIPSFRYNFLRSFLVPPPVLIEVADYPPNEEITLVTIESNINEVGVKQGCKFSVKNNFNTVLKVLLEFEPIDPELKELLDVSCKFEHSNQNFVELLPDETTNIKIRAVPKVDSRLTHTLLEKIDKISKIEFPNDKHNGLSIQNFRSTADEATQENLVSRLLKLRSGSSRLGKLLLRPEIIQPEISTENEDSAASQLEVSTKKTGSKSLLTSADVICVELVGALKLGPTSALLNYSSASRTALPMTTNEIIGGLVMEFFCRGKQSLISTSRDGEEQDSAKKEEADELMLSSGEHCFFISNPTKSALRFKIKSITCRYPGMMLQFTENIEQDGRIIPFSYCTDTVKVVLDPNEGEIAVGSALRVKAELVPCNPSEANLSTESELTSEFHNHNSNHMEGSAEGVLEQILLCMPIEVWDKDWPLHPPSIVYAHLLSDTYCPIIRSQPISELHRKKQQYDMILSDQGANDLSAKGTNESSVNVESYNLTDDTTHDTIGGSVLTSEAESVKVGIKLRGITPYPDCEFKGSIDLGRQVQRQDYLEWAVRIENRSKFKRHVFQVFSLSYPTSTHWLKLGQTGGIVHPNDSNSIMLYFNRMIPGQYLSFIIIRNIAGDCPDHVIRITMEVTADDWRKRSQPLSLPSQGTVDSLSYPWLKEYLPSQSLYLNDYCPKISSYDVSSVKDKVFLSSQDPYLQTGIFFAGITIKNTTPIALELNVFSKSKCFHLKLINENQEELCLDESCVVDVNQSVTIFLQLNLQEFNDVLAQKKFSETILASSIRSEWEGSHELKVVDKIFITCKLFDDLTFYVPVYEILS